jgi:SulP family sulfate permease
MILFPLGEHIFEKTGPDGISMFYVSCIVSQLVYSLGGSRFKGGVGSEMVCTVDQMAMTMLTIADRSCSFLSQNGIHDSGPRWR